MCIYKLLLSNRTKTCVCKSLSTSVAGFGHSANIYDAPQGLMKPFSRSVIDLFDGKKRYVLPLFQRQYVWTEENQLSRLWDDIESKANLRLTEKSTVPHFLGAIVVELVLTHGRALQKFLVIDGQQRLTTFQLLLTALRNVASQNKSEFAEELNRYIINDGIMEDANVEKYKVWPTQVDQPQMRAIVDSVSKGDLSGTTHNGQHMVNAYNYFFNSINNYVNLESMNSPKGLRIEALFNALKTDLALVSIELENSDDPQIIFETLNGFHEPLLPSDLLRNYIFQRINQSLQTPDSERRAQSLYDQFWLPLDQQFWKNEEKIGRSKRAIVDIFFQHFLSMKKASDVNVGRLYHEYKTWIEKENPYQSASAELEDIHRYSEVYRQIVDRAKDDDLGHFAEMTKTFDIKSAAPLVLYLCGEARLVGAELKEALSILESYIVRRAVCGLTNKNYNRFFLKLIEILRTQAQIPAEQLLRHELDKGTGTSVIWPSDSAFLQAFLERPLYSVISGQIEFILRKIEHHLWSSKSEELEIKSDLTVEHIMPRSWTTSWPLADGRVALTKGQRLNAATVDPEADTRDVLIDTIGNLTLLTRPLNSSLSNGPYDKKCPEICFQSALALNRWFQKQDCWNDETIKDRSEALFASAKVIWPRSSSSN